MFDLSRNTIVVCPNHIHFLGEYRSNGAPRTTMMNQTSSFVVKVLTDNDGFTHYYHPELSGKMLDRLEHSHREYMEPKPDRGDSRKALVLTLSGSEFIHVEPYDN